MTPADLNYRHLLYFWAVAKEGSVTRAAERLSLSAQAVSTQIGALERQLGQALFAPQGRSLILTDAGRTTLGYAEQIFQMGGRLREALASGRTARVRLAAGITDAVPKLVAFHLLETAIAPPLSLRLECVEGDFDHLLGELALDRLDLVIADRSAPQRANLKLHSHLLGVDGISLYAGPALQLHAEGFPDSIDGAPILLPSRSDPLRAAIDAWLEAHELRPEVVGEFSDSALLKTFGHAGCGLFPAPTSMRDDIEAQFNALPVGEMEGVRESWYVISLQRRIPHPAVAAIRAAGLGFATQG